MVDFDILLIIHVICGGISLVLGLSVLLQRKGTRLHKLVGGIYYYSMLIASFTALPMSYIRQNYFLFMVGVLTAFMVISGRRYISRRKTAKAGIFDWILTVIIALAGISFIAFGIYQFYKENIFGVVYIFFGMAGLFFAYQDSRNFLNRSPISNYWLTTHLQRMVGSYTASVTAFIVVNNTILPGVVAWLLPAVILVPLILIWTWKYRVNKVQKSADPVLQVEKLSNS